MWSFKNSFLLDPSAFAMLKLCCSDCYELMVILRGQTQDLFPIRGHHATVFGMLLPQWLPRVDIEVLVLLFKSLWLNNFALSWWNLGRLKTIGIMFLRMYIDTQILGRVLLLAAVAVLLHQTLQLKIRLQIWLNGWSTEGQWHHRFKLKRERWRLQVGKVVQFYIDVFTMY